MAQVTFQIFLFPEQNYAWYTGSRVSIRKEGVNAMQKLLAVDMRLKQSIFEFVTESFEEDGEFEEEDV